MCYDLAIAENGFSPMDVDELLWINGGSFSYDRHTETKTTTTTTTTTNPDGTTTTTTTTQTEKTTTSDTHIDSSKSIGQTIQNAWNAIKGWFSKGK